MSSAQNYSEKGLSSWYGKAFHGRKTSSGAVYDMHKLTAAHKSLPLNTWVKVKNLENGKEVKVLVNDRGPFHGNRIIDLSYAAAKVIGMVNQGIAPVQVTVVGSNGGWRKPDRYNLKAVRGLDVDIYIQLGAFSDINNANRMQKRASFKGYNSSIDMANINTQTLYRVRIGPMDHQTYLQILPNVRRDGFPQSVRMFDTSE